MIPICAKDPDQLNAERIALRIASLLTPLIFAICYVFAHCVLDIHGSPARAEILARLEEQCTRASAQHAGLTTSASVDALKRVDSTLRESMRVSDLSVTNIFRLGGQLIISLSDLVLPKRQTGTSDLEGILRLEATSHDLRLKQNRCGCKHTTMLSETSHTSQE